MMTHKENDIVSLLQYFKITKIHEHSISVEDLHSGENFLIIGAAKEKLSSADYHDSTIKVSKTKLAELLTNAYCTPFTVTFIKTNGDERILRGRLVDSDTLLGRSIVEDFDKNADERICQVDHRTISSLIINNTHYSVK